MEGQELAINKIPRTLSFTLRDVVAMGFRRRRIALICFFGVLVGAVLYAILYPSYRAETEILVRRDRIDPVVTSQPTTPLVVSNLISEEELNSEVELIKSQDVFSKIVQICDLDQNHESQPFDRNSAKRNAAAIERLRSKLLVEAVPKTNIIRVSFSSRDPKLAASVLSTLDGVYLEQHRAVHGPTAQFQFFDQQSDKAKRELDSIEARLKAFPSEIGIANPTLARDIALQKLNDFNANLDYTKEAIAETGKRIDALERLAQSVPPRLTTQERVADDAPVLQQMKTTLLNLELKRSDMLSKYQADYPPLRELEKEISETRATIAGEKPLNDTTTDQNPAYIWIKSELAKASADLQGYQARAVKTEGIVTQILESVRQLDRNSLEQQDLLRSEKTAEENYLLYSHKREEARITDALDQNHILNIGIAEKPVVPVFRTESLWRVLLFGLVLAIGMSVGTIFTCEYLDPSFRTPAEVQALLNLPVLATFPEQDNNGYRLGTGARE